MSVDFTKGYNDINNIYDTSQFNVGQILRLDLSFNTLKFSVLYTKMNYTDKNLVLIIRTEDADYPLLATG